MRRNPLLSSPGSLSHVNPAMPALKRNAWPLSWQYSILLSILLASASLLSPTTEPCSTCIRCTTPMQDSHGGHWRWNMMSSIGLVHRMETRMVYHAKPGRSKRIVSTPLILPAASQLRKEGRSVGIPQHAGLSQHAGLCMCKHKQQDWCKP